ncbi:uncharacterized protein LOC131219480 [Magnolia sinica]|uniref:uncharacterized protein LOC131219480 n=1 Tax=Magnolia sinica TaxID=86752 RepID=UPI00265A9E8C|nr:uncharacterized protein LOC131219480 [Magnolia sinica]
MAKVLLSSSPMSALLPKPSPIFYKAHLIAPKRIGRTKIHANLGGGDGETKRAEKKFITREQEPEQYWQTAGEREGENPMKTPLPYIIIFGMSTPFVILAIAFANGWVKVPVR